MTAIPIYLIRHGAAAASWGEDPDPPLSDEGRQQAQQAGQDFLRHIGRDVDVFVSPLRRTRETAEIICGILDATPVVELAVTELPSPTTNLQERQTWLQGIMGGHWSDPGAQQAGPHDLVAWRQAVVSRLLQVSKPTLFVSHFIAINVAVGHATGDDLVVNFRPGNCSRTELQVASGTLKLVARGKEIDSQVL